ncbi:MAG: hypothetical protein K8R53_03265 [Bacteroidales bacterium]|nr:hypothetical protein [Bacteroidales bacterium]
MSKFVAAVNCMDGRVQEPVIEYMKKTFNAEYVDMITEPGPDGILAERKDEARLQTIKERLAVSVEKHKSNLIGVFGHGDCAGNPVEKEIHIQQTMSAVALIKSWFEGVKINGYWIDENWKVNLIE